MFSFPLLFDFLDYIVKHEDIINEHLKLLTRERNHDFIIHIPYFYPEILTRIKTNVYRISKMENSDNVYLFGSSQNTLLNFQSHHPGTFMFAKHSYGPFLLIHFSKFILLISKPDWFLKQIFYCYLQFVWVFLNFIS